MKLIFFGTPQPAAEMLDVLIKAGHEILGVVTQPDRPQGRGKEVVFSPVKQLALDHKLPVEQPEKVKNNPEFINWLRKLQPEIIVVVAYGNILPPELLNIPKYGCLNLHASLLPKYRGAAPIQYALLNGETETGITVMKIAEALDSGDVLLQEKLAIAGNDDTPSLSKRLFSVGGPLLLKALRQIAEGKAKYQPQDEKLVTYAPTIAKESGEIDWRQSATDIHNRIRALVPWPVAHTFFQKQLLKIWQSEVVAFDLATEYQASGSIVAINRDGVVMATGKGQIVIKEVQLAGGKRLSAFDFALGHDVKIGKTLPN